MLIYLIAGATFGATMVGGLFALGLREKLPLILGFSAGAVIAVAFFDLLPEAMELGGAYGASNLLTATAIGFLVYLLLDRLLILHGDRAGRPLNDRRGTLGAGSLSVHSFLDGVAIGLAFRASHSVGLVVAAAVLTHDFSDGINTLNIVLKNGGSRAKALAWLFVDALAPLAGIVSTLFFAPSEPALAIMLAIFAGFFLYIGASDLIPESHEAHPKFQTTIATLIGAAALYFAVALAGR